MTHEYNILIKLLEDPDPEVYNVLTERILEHGTDIIPYLEDAGKSSLSKFHFERINLLTSEIIFRDNKERLASWIQDGGVDLVEGFYFLHRIIHPDSKQSEIIDAIQNIRSEIWLELNNRLTALEKIRIVNYFIFDKYNIVIRKKIPDHPLRFSLTSISKDRIDNAESIYAAYSIIARSLDLPVYAVEISGLSLFAWVDIPFTPKPGFDPSQAPILFFINPEENGRILGLEEVNNFLSRVHSWHVPVPFNACSDIILLKNFTRSLLKICQKAGKDELKKKLNDLLTLW